MKITTKILQTLTKELNKKWDMGVKVFNWQYSNCCNTCGWEDFIEDVNRYWNPKVFVSGMNKNIDSIRKGVDSIHVSHAGFTKETFQIIKDHIDTNYPWMEILWEDFNQNKCMELRVKEYRINN